MGKSKEGARDASTRTYVDLLTEDNRSHAIQTQVLRIQNMCETEASRQLVGSAHPRLNCYEMNRQERHTSATKS